MNNLNELNERANEMISWRTRKMSDRLIEIYPGLFTTDERSYPVVTKSGMNFLRGLCAQYTANELSVNDFLYEMQKVANAFSGWETEVNERLFDTAMQILSNN